MREKLLKTGMGCFVFASGVGVANTLLLPYARAHFGYPVWRTWAAYAAALLLFYLAGRAVSVLEDEKAARLARVIAPTAQTGHGDSQRPLRGAPDPAPLR